MCIEGLCEIADASASDHDVANTARGGDGGVGSIGGMSGTGGISGSGGKGGGGDNGGTDGNAGAAGTTSSAGKGGMGGGAGQPPPPPPGMCDESAVSVACPAPPGNPGCSEIFCGERLWQNGATSFNGFITYRIDDPAGQFSDAYKNAIRTIAQAWSDATQGVVGFRECSICKGRIVVVVPGTGDGIVDPTQFEEVLPMPVIAGASPPLHTIAHQWGHVVGLGHTYERADRDRYLRFDPAVWCGADRTGLPPRCAFSPDQPGVPRIASDTFGAFDEKSKMNGFKIDGICGSGEPDRTSGMPTDGDGSAVQELYVAHVGSYSPFVPIAQSPSPTQPMDYQLAPGVDPVGSPAITVWKPPAVEIFARGTDGVVYATHNELFGTLFRQWASWTPVATDVAAEPAVVFADSDTLHLAVRTRADGSIRMRTRANGTWGKWASLGAPPAGAASAPSIAAVAGRPLTVVVLGNDGVVYRLICTDPAAMCTGSSARPDAWSALPASPTGAFTGKTMATFLQNGDLVVTAVASDYSAWMISGLGSPAGLDFSTSDWSLLPVTDLAPDDPNPGVAVETYGGGVGLYARGARGRLVSSTPGFFSLPLGGLVQSTPAATAALDGEGWVYVAALVMDHGNPGVWLRFYGGDVSGFQRPCNFNMPGTCAQCGCDFPNGPGCTL